MVSKRRKDPLDLTQTETTHSTAGNVDACTTSDCRHLTDLAYQIWQERGCPQGSPEDDWFEAERRLAREMQSGDQRDTKVDLK